MAGNWHDCISSDLDRVDSVIREVTLSENPELTEMCDYVLSNHGKRIRPAICVLSYHACGGDDGNLHRSIDVAAAIEIIHNATLIHDDINDQGELRRGAKALYREYTIGKSIVVGDYLFALGFRLLGSTSNEVVDYVIDAASGLAAGEFDQKQYERNESVGESEYMKIIGGKTARLIECAAKCGAFIASADAETIDCVGDFAYKAGMAFQIIDDVLDVAGDVGSTGKKVGNDIVEGKPTLPIIMGMQDPEAGPRIAEIFEDPSSDYAEAAEAIALIKSTDSISRCRAVAESIADEAKHHLDPLPDSEYKTAMCQLVDFFVSRDR
ncbi:polyprenyl synthase [Candidatus Methanomethylophilus sp. 1R26]|uniref:polyprenyl synthetase family protein n=1 Tax=Candidatus Methanomethylophilus sp. 1R26 TaxID=1769296 RepID=UPI000736EF81|nr:polyprenyl synthetase family protein [Candidatus Methanomethylophilus sp. 1R26]KUE73901.1 polyprenyl synthase [Candidatus Methanomethylophilus sp. 1R26]